MASGELANGMVFVSTDAEFDTVISAAECKETCSAQEVVWHDQDSGNNLTYYLTNFFKEDTAIVDKGRGLKNPKHLQT